MTLRKSSRRKSRRWHADGSVFGGAGVRGERGSRAREYMPGYLVQGGGDVLEAPEIEIDEDWLPEEEAEDDPGGGEEGGEGAGSQASRRQGSSRAAYRCKYCMKTCRSNMALNMHIVKVHGVSIKNRLLCRHCFKQFVFQHELDLHIKFACKILTRDFKCKNCTITFQTNNELLDHPCSKNTKRPFFCSMKGCTYSGKSVKDLREHCARHMTIKPYLCNTCGCAFATRKDMDRHTDRHKDTKDMVCQDCGRAYRSRHSLQKHRAIHRHSDKFKCTVCPYSTPFQNCFKQHMLKHASRKHKCPQCNKHLRTAASLVNHVKKIHDGNKMFSCQYCDFSTTVGKRLSGHMTKHRKEREEEYSDSDEDMTALPLPATTTSAPLSAGLQVLQPSTAVPMPVRRSPPPYVRVLPSPSRITLTSAQYFASPPLSSHIPVLSDTTLVESSEEVEISGQAADTLMSNIVASSYADISQEVGGGGGLAFYVSDMAGPDPGVSSSTAMSIGSLVIPDTVTSMSDNDLNI